MVPQFRKNFTDLTGRVFGRLTVLGYGGRLVTPSGHWRHSWRCRCTCGTVKPAVSTNSLLNGTSTSCGCGARDGHRDRLSVHGLAGSTEYRIWCRMRERCNNPNNKDFVNYGGRGIRVCDRWSDPALFILDMGARPSRAHSIERENNSGDYEPGNCYWATVAQQNNNRRNNRQITVNGRTQTLAQWAREAGVSLNCLSRRLDHYGWSLEKAVSTPAAFRTPRA